MKKILCVEDDVDAADALKTTLEIAGYKVAVASRGKIGVRMLQKQKFDLVILDIMMPDMSGWDVFQKVKHLKMKFAFLSALSQTPERLQELKKQGVSFYITKPFTKDGLVRKVKQTLKA